MNLGEIVRIDLGGGVSVTTEELSELCRTYCVAPPEAEEPTPEVEAIPPDDLGEILRDWADGVMVEVVAILERAGVDLEDDAPLQGGEDTIEAEDVADVIVESDEGAGNMTPTTDDELPVPGEGDAVEAEQAGPVIEYAAEAEEDTTTTLQERDLNEGRSGHALVEGDLTAWDGAGPLKIKAVLIEPGAGNKADRHYYPAEMLARDAHVLEGGKMYACDHDDEQKNVRTEVASILKCPAGFTDTGGVVAEIGIFDPTFAQATANRASLGVLESLETSIIGRGATRQGKVDGQDYDIVQEITNGSADFVTQAGAGGRAIALTESDTQAAVEDKAEETVTMLTTEEVREHLDGKEGIHAAIIERVAESEHENVEAIDAALTREAAYMQKLVEAGAPEGMDESAPDDGEPEASPEWGGRTRSDEDHMAEVNKILAEAGIRPAASE